MADTDSRTPVTLGELHVQWRGMNVQEQHDQWVNYEYDMANFIYKGPDILCGQFVKLGLPKDSLILDMGCGTGLLGKMLKEEGYDNLHGLDCSGTMLAAAKEKGVYKQLFHRFLKDGCTLPMESGTYDAVVMAGGIFISPVHFPVGTFDEMFRVIKKGGIFIHVSLERSFLYEYYGGLRVKFDRMVEEGQVERTMDEVFGNFFFIEGKNVNGHLQAFKLLTKMGK